MSKSHSNPNHTLMNYVSTGYNIINHTKQIETARVKNSSMFHEVIFYWFRICPRFTKKALWLNTSTEPGCMLLITMKITKKGHSGSNFTSAFSFAIVFAIFKKHTAHQNTFGSLNDLLDSGFRFMFQSSISNEHKQNIFIYWECYWKYQKLIIKK